MRPVGLTGETAATTRPAGEKVFIASLLYGKKERCRKSAGKRGTGILLV